MTRLPEGLPFQKFPRVAAYALLAALITTALFAADSAYRWSYDRSTKVAVPLPQERPVAASEPAPAEAQPVNPPSQALTQMPERENVGVDERADDRAPSGSTPNSATASIPNSATASVENSARGGAAPSEISQHHKQPKSSRHPKQQVRRLPAKQVAREHATPRRPVQAEKPNVYWERDTQLGFAPQLRKRTCNPATGRMPMQCYYPREGREQFPAKPLN